MQVVAILHCPGCLAERGYIAHDTPPDVNLARCMICGHQWGYARQLDVRDPQPGHIDPVIRAGGVVYLQGQPQYVARANLDPVIAAEGVRLRNEQRMGQLDVRRTNISAQRTKASLVEAMREEDPLRRSQMLRNLTEARGTSSRAPDASRS